MDVYDAAKTAIKNIDKTWSSNLADMIVYG